MTFIDVFGYIGTTLVAISFLSKSMFKLRLLNMVGALIITTYAIIISAWPVALLDGLIVLINGYQLLPLLREKNKMNIFMEKK